MTLVNDGYVKVPVLFSHDAIFGSWIFSLLVELRTSLHACCMAPRRRTCLTTGRAEAERCRACANPKLKARCELSATNLANQQPAVDELSLFTQGPRAEEAPRQPARWESVNEDDETVDEHPAAHSMAEPSSSSSPRSKRERRAPAGYQPADFWRRPIPEKASSTSTQMVRARELADMKERELRLSREAGLKEGAQRAERVIDEIKERFQLLACQVRAKGDV